MGFVVVEGGVGDVGDSPPVARNAANSSAVMIPSLSLSILRKIASSMTGEGPGAVVCTVAGTLVEFAAGAVAVSASHRTLHCSGHSSRVFKKNS